MARRVGQRPLLSPTGHACKNDLRIALQTDLGTDAQFFTNPGAEGIDDHMQAGGSAGPVDADNFRTHVRQHHASHWSGTDARQFDYRVAVQRSHIVTP